MKKIGIVMGNTSPDTFYFQLKGMQASVGDIIVTPATIPNNDKHGTETNVMVWGRILLIDRFNPFFPQDAAAELADNETELVDTVLSEAKDQLSAEVKVMGATDTNLSVEEYSLRPLSYPVKPASAVYYPREDDIKKLLTGSLKDKTPLRIGTLIARKGVEVSISAQEVASKHMAILAMTGGGKSVAARQIIKELAQIGHPVLIFDPHGDYLGIYEKQAKYFPDKEVNVFYPKIQCSVDDSIEVVSNLIIKIGITYTQVQWDTFNRLCRFKEMLYIENTSIISHMENLQKKASSLAAEDDAEAREETNKSTWNAVARGLRICIKKLKAMETSNERLRNRLKNYDWQELPDVSNDPEKIISKDQISIVYVGGYDHITQSTIVSITLENLFNEISSLRDKIPPFVCLIEEAHNFVPSSREKSSEGTPSLPTIRKVITEGRKFGISLLLVSQRPSRLDETALSQCNTFLVLKLVNPRDQSWVKNVMENLEDKDAKSLVGFGPGQGLISGHAVRFPLQVQIDFYKDLISENIDQSDYIKKAREFPDHPSKKSKKDNASKANDLMDKDKRSKKHKI